MSAKGSRPRHMAAEGEAKEAAEGAARGAARGAAHRARLLRRGSEQRKRNEGKYRKAQAARKEGVR